MNLFPLFSIILQTPSTIGSNTSQFPTLTIISVIFIVTAFFTWFFIHKSKVEERRLLIEKDVDPSKLPERKVFNFDYHFPWLKVGCVLTSATIGLSIGIVLFEMGYDIFEGAPFVLLFLFGGIGMIIAHFVDTPKN